MFGSSSRDLEARVERLERLISRVLAELRVLQAGGTAGSVVETGSEPPEEPESGHRFPGPTRAAAHQTTEEEPGSGSADGPAEPIPRRSPEGDSEEGWTSWVMRGSFLARMGTILLLLSVAFFFKYSVDQGWLVPMVRLAMGFFLGVSLLLLGFRGASKGEYLGTALAGGGIATLFITGFTGYQWYSVVAYPVAFGLLVAASALGTFLSLRSGRQALAMLGMVGALSTPLLLTPPVARIGGLVGYVCLIVAAVAAIYTVQSWRTLLLTVAATSWLVLWVAVSKGAEQGGVSPWALQAGIAFCAFTFWLGPVLGDSVRARHPGPWSRPEGGEDPGDGSDSRGSSFLRELEGVAWHVHLDVLSLVMPVVAIAYSARLWDLSRVELGWVFLVASVLAQGLASVLARTEDPLRLAGTQRTVSILLGTVGAGLVLTGDLLYTAFIAEATVLSVVGARRRSPVLLGLGTILQLLVAGIFILRILRGWAAGEALHAGDLSHLLDLAALGAAAFVGTRLPSEEWRKVYFVAAYLGFLAFLGGELGHHEPLLYLALVAVSVLSHVLAKRRRLPLLETLGHVTGFLVVMFLVTSFQGTGTLATGDVTSLVDLVAIASLAYTGTLMSGREARLLFLIGAYVLFLFWTGRELMPFQGGQAWASLALGAEGAVMLLVGSAQGSALAQRLGLGTLLVVVVKLLLVDLSAVEPLWRVLLFSVFGGLFLLLSKFVRFKREVPSRDSTEEAPGS